MKNPKIRFKGFMDGWEQRKLEDLVDVRSGRDYKHLSDGDIPVYGTGGYMLSVNEALSYCEDAIGIGRKGTINKPYVLKAPFWTVDTLFYAVPRTDYDLNFVFDIFQNIDWKKKDESTGVPSLSKVAINAIEIQVPSYLEQNAIGSYLSKIDHLITLHQRKCKETKILKKYMLQKMFPQNGSNIPEIRFDGFTDAWEPRKLSECVRRKSETMLSDKKNPSVEYEDVNSEVGTLNKDITQKGIQKSGIAFDDKDVLYGKLRPYLHNWLNPHFKGVAVGDWWVLNPIDLNKNFLYAILQTPNYDNAANQSSGTKMPRADWNLVSNTEFYVPVSFEEQEKIANVFINLDDLIILHQRKCNELQNIKKFMLQNMFV